MATSGRPSYRVDLKMIGAPSRVWRIDPDGNEVELSNDLRGLDITMRVDRVTTIDLHAVADARVEAVGPDTTLFHDCEFCLGHPYP